MRAYVCKFHHFQHYLEEDCLSNIMYDCQDMKAAAEASLQHNDTSCTEEKKQGGK